MLEFPVRNHYGQVCSTRECDQYVLPGDGWYHGKSTEKYVRRNGRVGVRPIYYVYCQECHERIMAERAVRERNPPQPDADGWITTKSGVRHREYRRRDS